jgi:hypothetical protein
LDYLLDNFLDHCWTNFGVTLDAKIESKRGPLFRKAPGGRFLAVSGSILISGVVWEAKCSKTIAKTIQRAVFEITSFRYRKYLRWFFGVTLAQFGEAFGN